MQAMRTACTHGCWTCPTTMGAVSRPTAEASSVARVPDAGLQRRVQVSDEPVDSDQEAALTPIDWTAARDWILTMVSET